MGDFDIFNPKISKVIAGIDNKTMLWHSSERKLGKTAQACRMPKPFYLRFEMGINAIDGLPYAELTNWRDFKQVNKQLTDPKTLDKAKELYKTIIFDTVDVAVQWCEDYICAANGINKLGDLAYGQGYSLMSKEWFKEINKLTNAGYAIIFIAHSKEKEKIDPISGEKYMQLCPVGGSSADLILNLVDFIGYIRSNGLSESGEEIPSSIYFANTREFQAGSRFKYMPKVIKEFTAENVIAAIKEAVEKEEKETGHKGITAEEQKKIEKKEKIPFDQLMKNVQEMGQKLVEADKIEDLTGIVEEVLGTGKKVSECTSKQYDAVAVIYDELKDKVEELGL